MADAKSSSTFTDALGKFPSIGSTYQRLGEHILFRGCLGLAMGIIPCYLMRSPLRWIGIAFSGGVGIGWGLCESNLYLKNSDVVKYVSIDKSLKDRFCDFEKSSCDGFNSVLYRLKNLSGIK